MEKFGAGNTIYVNTIQAAMYVVFSDAYDGITCAYLNLVARSVFFHKFYMSMSIHFWALPCSSDFTFELVDPFMFKEN